MKTLINSLMYIYKKKKTQRKLRRSLVRLPVSRQPELEFAPNSAFPFFDWKKITIPALVLFIIYDYNVNKKRH